MSGARRFLVLAVAGAWLATAAHAEAPAGSADWTLSVLDGIFAAEARDEPWATDREVEILRLRTRERLAGVTSIDAECRTTVCRVRVGFDPTRARRTLHALLVTPPLNTSGFHAADPEDERKIRMYVSKEGTVLQEHPVLVAALAAKLEGESVQQDPAASAAGS